MVITIVFFAFIFLFGSLLNSVLHFSQTKSAAWLASLFTIQSLPSPPGRQSPPRLKSQDSDLRRVFATFDHNGDGFITRRELKDSLENLGLFISDQDLASLLHKLDANGDGSIDLEEFCALYESMLVSGKTEGNNGKGATEAGDSELREAFDVFDENGDGFITVEELGSVLCSLGLRKGFRLEECKEMIRNVDTDGDGRVNFKEFQQMMKAGGLLAIS